MKWGIYHSVSATLTVTLHFVIQTPSRKSHSFQLIQALGISYISHYSLPPLTSHSASEKKNQTPNKWLTSNCLVHQEKEVLFSIQQQPLRDCRECAVLPSYVCVCMWILLLRSIPI